MRKKTIGCIVFVIAIGILLGLVFRPNGNSSMQDQDSMTIWDTLQDFVESEHQSMKLDASLRTGNEKIDLHSTIYRTQLDEVEYLAFEQENGVFYIVDNLLVLENGKAYKLTESSKIPEENDDQAADKTVRVFEHILKAYKEFELTINQKENSTEYCVTATGSLAKNLMQELLPMEQEMFHALECIQIKVVTQGANLLSIVITGEAVLNDENIQVEIVLSEICILEKGEYDIPDVIRDSVHNIDRDELFCLSRDIYPLIKAAPSIENLSNRDGMVQIVVDFNLFQLDTTISLAELKTGIDKIENSQGAYQMPEWLGMLFIEGEISYVKHEDSHQYALKLDANATENIAKIFVPDLENYRVQFTSGETILLLKADEVDSLSITIEGMVDIFIKEIPVSIEIKYQFY